MTGCTEVSPGLDEELHCQNEPCEDFSQSKMIHEFILNHQINSEYYSKSQQKNIAFVRQYLYQVSMISELDIK